MLRKEAATQGATSARSTTSEDEALVPRAHEVLHTGFEPTREEEEEEEEEADDDEEEAGGQDGRREGEEVSSTTCALTHTHTQQWQQWPHSE